MVATSRFELVYVNSPLLSLVGRTMEKSPSPIIFAATAKLPRTVLSGFTANNAVIECIARGTPILVCRHPSVEEYLGAD